MKNLRKGMKFIHKDTKKYITFGKKNDDGTLWFITSDKQFLTLTVEQVISDYYSDTQLKKEQAEKRKRSAW